MKTGFLHRLLAGTLLTTALIIPSTDTKAAGFYTREYTDVNRAFAGDVAGGYDASTVYANPAGMMLLKQAEIKGGGSFNSSSAQFNNTGSTAPVGIALGTDNGGTSDITIDFIPNLYAVYPFEHVAIGIGFTSPFDLRTNYNDGWIGRFDSIKSHITTGTISPTIAFDVSDQFTVGLGIDIQRARLNLTKAKTFSDNLDALFPALLGISAPEFRSQIEGDDWAYGVNAGLIYKAADNLNFGLDFHSGTTHSIDSQVTVTAVPTGNSTVDGVVNNVMSLLGHTNVPTTTDIKLPNILTLGTSWDVTSDLNLGAQVQWFNWKRFDTITTSIKDPFIVPFAGTLAAAGTVFDSTPQNFKNSFAVSVGTDYKFSDTLSWQLGFLYDETPTQDGFRNTSIPDGDRKWITTGLTWEYIPGFSVNVGYAHIFISNELVNVTRNAALDTPITGFTNNTTVVGTLDAHANILSVSARVEF